MGTFTISASGFASLPAAPPVGWPAGLVWPGAVAPNGTKSWTVSDADWVKVVTWSANINFADLGGDVGTPGTPTIGQILIAFAQIFVNGVKTAVVQQFTPPPVVPPPPDFV